MVDLLLHMIENAMGLVRSSQHSRSALLRTFHIDSH
jgi:hypothetical protein